LNGLSFQAEAMAGHPVVQCLHHFHAAGPILEEKIPRLIAKYIPNNIPDGLRLKKVQNT
jgi:hypothetical protein